MDKRKRMVQILAGIMAAIMLLSLVVTVFAEEGGREATILFTHDLHSHLLPSKDEDGGDTVTPAAIAYEDYPEDSVFPIAGCGFGGCLVSVDLIKRVKDEFGLPFSPILGFGEDLSFCLRATKLGVEMFCDSRVKLGHVGLGTITEDTYKQLR